MKQLLKIAEKIKRPNAIIEHSTLVDMVESYVETYDGSWRELALIADRLENMGKTILDTAKSKAHIEAQLEGVDEKHEFMGNEITPRTLTKWEYVETPYIQKCEQQLEQISEQLKPLKDKEKSVKKSLKSEQKKQESDGTAQVVSQTQTIAIKRK